MPCDSEHQYITPRQQRRTKRRTKRTRPEKKSSPMDTLNRPKHTTKPKNHNKIANLKARRDISSLDATDYSDLEHQHEYERHVHVAFIHKCSILPKNRRYPYITHCPWLEDFNQDDGTFSIYADGWSY